jgi:two-component system phosphate regulon sensor histidine kinase PhoR
VISIRDSGIGIEKDYFTKIFEKFWQVKSSLTRDINGTWLGLPIVKAIVEQMNGHIEVESEVWKGSKFSVHLPINN